MRRAAERPRLQDGVAVVVVDGEAVLYDGDVHYLNRAAAVVLERCDGSATVEEIAVALAELHEEPREEVERHVRTTVDSLVTAGIVVADGSAGARRHEPDARRLVRIAVPSTP